MPVVQECDVVRRQDGPTGTAASPTICGMDPSEPTPAEKFLHQDALVIRRRWASKWLWLAGLVILAGAGAWWITHPDGFGRTGHYDVQTPAGRPTFVGILGPNSGPGRTIKISDVTARIMHAPAGTEAVALICRGGAIGSTSDANAFCAELVDAAGETLHYGEATMEQLVLRITSPTPGDVEVDGVTLTFRDGLRSGSAHVGPTISVTVLNGPGSTS